MALSNAERQRRFRERRAAALRNVGGPASSIAHLLQSIYSKDPESFGIAADGVAAQVADNVAAILTVLLGVHDDESMEASSIVRMVGGSREYCDAALAYATALRNRRRTRTQQEPEIEPPSLPAT